MRLDRDRAERLPAIAGLPPSLLRPPAGCHFHPRCPHAFAKCRGEVPALEARLPGVPGHLDRCWLGIADKRRLRVVGERIGLASEETVIA
jgi:oligopeptide/dipeptide ABC transporter ATP-binding protein